MRLDELKEHCLKTLKQTEKFPTKTFEEHELVLRLIENQTSVIAELEKIKAEITACTQQEEGEVPACINYGIKLSTEIVEKHIAELKGEKK
jgi:hypothetical protein